MSGIVFGCIVWCPSGFTSLPGLESFPLGSNGLFHMFIPPPGFTTPAVRPSCATYLISSSPVLTLQSSCRIQEADVTGLLPHQVSLLHLWQVCAWSYGKGWSLFAWLCFPTCMWWDGCHISWNVFPRSRSNARAYSRILSPSTSGYSLPYPIPPCTSLYPVPARPTWLFQSPHGIRNSDVGILMQGGREIKKFILLGKHSAIISNQRKNVW